MTRDHPSGQVSRAGLPGLAEGGGQVAGRQVHTFATLQGLAGLARGFRGVGRVRVGFDPAEPEPFESVLDFRFEPVECLVFPGTRQQRQGAADGAAGLFAGETRVELGELSLGLAKGQPVAPFLKTAELRRRRFRPLRLRRRLSIAASASPSRPADSASRDDSTSRSTPSVLTCFW